jgi:hypothetical protein
MDNQGATMAKSKTVTIAGRAIPEGKARELGLHPDQRATTTLLERQMAILKLFGHQNDPLMGALKAAQRRAAQR